MLSWWPSKVKVGLLLGCDGLRPGGDSQLSELGSFMGQFSWTLCLEPVRRDHVLPVTF